MSSQPPIHGETAYAASQREIEQMKRDLNTVAASWVREAQQAGLLPD